MKWMVKVAVPLALMFFILSTWTFAERAYSEESKIIVTHLVSQHALKGEPILINGVILKKTKHQKKSLCIMEIRSETYKGYTLVIQGEIKARVGDVIEGLLYKGKFAVTRRLVR